MYRRLFQEQVETVLKAESHLLSENELELLGAYFDAPEEAQHLLCRLLSRRWKWIRTSSITYSEVPDPASAAEMLKERGMMWVWTESGKIVDLDGKNLEKPLESDTTPIIDLINSDDEQSAEDSDTSALFASQRTGSELFGVLTVDELRAIGNAACITIKSGMPKAALIKSIQTAIDRRGSAATSKILKLVFDHVKSLVTLAPVVVSLAARLCLIYYRRNPQYDIPSAASLTSPYTNMAMMTMTMSILVSIGQRQFPRYKCARTPLVFTSRDHLLAYEKSMQLKAEMDACASVEVAHRVAQKILPLWRHAIVRREEHVTGTPWLQRFCPGWNHTKAVELYLPWLGKAKQYDQIVELLNELLAQRLYRQGKRGKWHNLLALTLHTHLKKHREAQRACIEGLEDPSCHRSYVIALEKRLVRLQVVLRIPWREQRHFDHDVLRKPQEKYFVATRIPDTSSHRPLYEAGDDAVHVEEFALRMYREEEHLDGFHSENSILSTLFAHLMFDELFLPSIPGVFETEYQGAPLDFGSDMFYPSRKQQIDDKLDMIRQGRFVDIIKDMDNAERERCTIVTGLNWDYTLEQLIEIATNIGGAALAAICLLFCKDGRNRGGMPDLCLWSTNPHVRRVLFSEVKGPGDVLSDKQRVWMDSLLTMGIEVHLCFVSAESEEQVSYRPSAAKPRKKHKHS